MSRIWHVDPNKLMEIFQRYHSQYDFCLFFLHTMQALVMDLQNLDARRTSFNDTEEDAEVIKGSEDIFDFLQNIRTA